LIAEAREASVPKFVLDLAKEAFKFSCSHFTIFGPDKAERLHGHNYYVTCQIEVRELIPQLGLAFDFHSVKPSITAACDELDEHVLVPKNSPYLKVTETATQVEMHFGDRFYSLPKEDVRLLPVVNITSEELAKYLGLRLEPLLGKEKSIVCFRVSIQETHGQTVHYETQLS